MKKSSPLKAAIAGAAIGTSISLGTISFVSDWEGKRNTPYLDIVGVPTVCYGHTGPDIEQRFYSQTECEAMLMGDLMTHVTVMLRAIKVPLSQGEMTAYSSLVFNIGVRAFSNSTLLQLLNAGDRKGACDQLLRWVKAGGRTIKGLVNRRRAEHTLCIGPVYAGK